MELILEAGDCNASTSYAIDVIKEVGRLRDLAPQGLDVLLKVQMYQGVTLTKYEAPRYDQTSGPAESQGELFENPISYQGWAALHELAVADGVPMFASVFDHEAVEAAVGMGMTRLKIASGDVTYLSLIDHALHAMERIRWGHLYISTGASDYDDLADLDKVITDGGAPTTLMACHLAYPTYHGDANLARIGELRHATNRRYPIGYSDHTRGGREILPLLLGLGVHSWEKHFTIAPGTGGDHDFAIEGFDVETLFEDYLMYQAFMGSPNLTPTEAELPARNLARRGLYARTNIDKGDLFTMGNIAVLRPAKGAKPANELSKFLGKSATKNYTEGNPL